MRAAAVERAGHVLAAPDRDDACVLICLTVRTLAPHVRLIASAREEENIKLLYKAGADVVVAPSVSGGRLMAAAVRQRAVVGFLEDLLAFHLGESGPRWTMEAVSVLEPPAAVGRLLYRIAHEAVTNASRHAHARHVSLTLRREEGAWLLNTDGWRSVTEHRGDLQQLEGTSRKVLEPSQHQFTE